MIEKLAQDLIDNKVDNFAVRICQICGSARGIVSNCKNNCSPGESGNKTVEPGELNNKTVDRSDLTINHWDLASQAIVQSNLKAKLIFKVF